jgi:myo-inositol-1-phosphate synthase
MKKIKVALLGIGNCASSLVQGVYYYSDPSRSVRGLIHPLIGDHAPSDLSFVLAIDTDARKVGRDLADAIFAPPNCTTVFQQDIPRTGVTVMMGRVLDGMADHMLAATNGRGFERADAMEATRDEIVAALRDSGAEVLVNYLPVGSEEAVRFYMDCALEAGVAVVNCMPVFIASDPAWERRFQERRLPIVGDDIKSQVGATIVHRVLSNLFRQRGVTVSRTYQLNTGGNTDFMNMLDRERLMSKKESKTEAVQSSLAEPLDAEDIHIGPSDYIPWLNDNKLCFLRMEGALFGDVPINLELRLSVEDSPNSAAVVIDAVRCCKVALERGLGGALIGPSAYFCKHPPQQFSDDIAAQLTDEFISGDALAAE